MYVLVILCVCYAAIIYAVHSYSKKRKRIFKELGIDLDEESVKKSEETDEHLKSNKNLKNEELPRNNLGTVVTSKTTSNDLHSENLDDIASGFIIGSTLCETEPYDNEVETDKGVGLLLTSHDNTYSGFDSGVSSSSDYSSDYSSDSCSSSID